MRRFICYDIEGRSSSREWEGKFDGIRAIVVGGGFAGGGLCLCETLSNPAGAGDARQFAIQRGTRAIVRAGAIWHQWIPPERHAIFARHGPFERRAGHGV